MTMKVLVLAPYLPAPPVDGGRIRIAQLVSGLAERHTVHLLVLAPPGPETDAGAAALRELGLRVEVVPHRPNRARAALRALGTGRSLYASLVWSPAFLARLDRLLRSEGYDAVQCELPYLLAGCGPLLAGRTASPLWVLDEQNVEHRLNELLGRAHTGLRGLVYRSYARRELMLRRREELDACRSVDRVLAVSEVDRGHLRTAVPDLPVSVVPNGVDLHRYRPSLPPGSGGNGAVFIGKLDYRPNLDGLAWFCRQVLPHIRRRALGFTFRVVGGGLTRAVRSLAALPGVEVVGRVDDTRPYLRAAAVVVVPLRAGSGTRLKVLEAMAAGRAVVSTSIGCEGLDVVDGQHLLVADNPGTFAARVLELVADPERRARLAQAGRGLVERRYGWPGAVAALEAVYEAALVERARDRAAGADRRPA
jgi:polysaccharide biosynthesis protein PslH